MSTSTTSQGIAAIQALREQWAGTGNQVLIGASDRIRQMGAQFRPEVDVRPAALRDRAVRQALLRALQVHVVTKMRLRVHTLDAGLIGVYFPGVEIENRCFLVARIHALDQPARDRVGQQAEKASAAGRPAKTRGQYEVGGFGGVGQHERDAGLSQQAGDAFGDRVQHRLR